MIAPLLDDEEHLRGLVIYGSSSERWFDCVEAGARRQCLLRGEDDAEARARAIRDEMTTQAVTDGRPAVYHRQLDEAEVAHAWSRVRRPVLVLHGEHDWVVSEAESAGIARLARGTLRIVPRVDHLFTSHDSLADSLKAHGKGRFEPTLMAECAAWMRELSSAEPV
jgi:pimeloyl-ACP methyl ester carboxylesterase